MPLASRAAAAALLALLALAPPTQAEGEQEFRASSLQAEGEAQAAGPLAALHVTGPMDPLQPGFLLAAERLRIETDHEHYNFTPGLANPYPYNTTAWRYTTAGNASHATLANAEARDGYSLYVVPTGPTWAEVGASLVRVAAADQPTTVRQPHHFEPPQGRRLQDADVRGSHLVDGLAGEPTLRLTGSFLAVFWEWDLSLQAGGGSPTVVESGEQMDRLVDLPPVPEVGQVRSPGKSYSREVYAYAENATLELRVADAVWKDLYLDVRQGSSAGPLLLRDALPAATPGVAPTDLKFNGPVGYATLPADGGLAVRVGPLPRPSPGALEPAQGTRIVPLQPDEVPSAASRLDRSLGLGSAVALAVGAAACVAAVRFRQDRAMARVQAFLLQGESQRVLPLLRLPLRTRRHRREATLIGIVAALNVRDLAQARSLLADSERRGDDPAVNAYLRACLAAAEDDLDAARLHLRRSVALDRALLDHARGNPLLSVLLDAPRPPQEAGYA